MSECNDNIECDLLENGYLFTKYTLTTNTGVARFDLMHITRPITCVYWKIHTDQYRYIRFKIKSRTVSHDIKEYEHANTFDMFHFISRDLSSAHKYFLCDLTSYLQLEFDYKSDCNVDLYIVYQ